MRHRLNSVAKVDSVAAEFVLYKGCVKQFELNLGTSAKRPRAEIEVVELDADVNKILIERNSVANRFQMFC